MVISEAVDINQPELVIDLSLEEHAAKQLKPKASKVPSNLDEHLYSLVLDKNIQGIPWGKLCLSYVVEVSAVESLVFNFSTTEIAFAKRKLRESVGQLFDPKLGSRP